MPKDKILNTNQIVEQFMAISKVHNLLDAQTGRKMYLTKMIRKQKPSLLDFNLESWINLSAVTLKSEI
jgi:hypothetical protein